jgi:hypothetical protein
MELDDRRVELTFLRQTLLQILKLGWLRQASEPKQIASFLKIGVVGQFMNVNSAIGKDATVTIDVANVGVGGNNTFQTFGGRGAGHARHGLSHS